MATLAEADASVAMIYLMHILGTAMICSGASRLSSGSHTHIAADRRRQALVDSRFQRSRIAQPFLGTGIAGTSQR